MCPKSNPVSLRRDIRVIASNLAVGTTFLALPLANALADVTLPPISVGAGVRTSFTHSAPNNGVDTDNFTLDSIRLYINGSVTDNIKFTFNTEYDGLPRTIIDTEGDQVTSPGNHVIVMDAIGRFEFSDSFNIWAGRFLPPSDRANLYGPYYANNIKPYVDGVGDVYPNVAVGRDNGVAYWGQFGIVKVQAGAFDGPSATGNKSLLGAARVMVDLWDPEPGYYLNGTYYGGKDILTFGLAGQIQAGKKTYGLDSLMEKKFGSSGTLSVEAEYLRDQNLSGSDAHGYYVLVSYLLPQTVGIGKLQPLVKYGTKTTNVTSTTTSELKTTEVDLNYIIKDFNARVGLFYLDQRTSPGSINDKQYGLMLQLQM